MLPRHLLGLLSVMLSVCVGPAAAEDAYPSRPIRLVTAFPPGGTTDILARLLAPRLTEGLGRPVVVENRAGGNTVIGTDIVAKAAPDGYTLLLASNSHVILPNMAPTPYDALKDFAAIATISRSEQLMVLHPAVPGKSLQEFVAYARSRRGELNYASSGNGNVTHLAGEKFNLMTGAQVRQINYKGTGPAVIDLVGGQVQLNFSPVIAVLSHVKSGRLRAIGISGKQRFAALPDVPTFAEAGYADLDVPAWYGILAPAGLPDAIAERLAAEFNRVLALPEIRSSLAEQGSDVYLSTRAEFAAQMRTDLENYGRIVRDAGIKAE